MKANGGNPPVESKAVMANGKKRGIRLINLASLMAYIEKQKGFTQAVPERSGPETESKSGSSVAATTQS